MKQFIEGYVGRANL